MHVTVLNGDFTDAEALLAVKYQLGNIAAPIPEHIIRKMVGHWRVYKRDGMSDTWILAEMKRQKVAIGGMTGGQGGAFPVLSDNQVGHFVTAMKRLSKGDMPQNPREAPSYAETYGPTLDKMKKGAKDVLGEVPWGTIGLIFAAGLALHAFAGGLGRGLGSR